MKKIRWISFIMVSLFVCGCSGGTDTITAGTQSVQEEESTTQEATEEVIYVYVCGNVEQPGVYCLRAQDRICDAIEKAGGVTADAVPEALNQAEHMSDGQTLYVPGREETDTASGTETDTRINLNQATKEQLMTLPGIGESKADAILQYRETNGPFQNIEDLLNISGIKEGVFQKIKDAVKV